MSQPERGRATMLDIKLFWKATTLLENLKRNIYLSDDFACSSLGEEVQIFWPRRGKGSHLEYLIASNKYNTSSFFGQLVLCDSLISWKWQDIQQICCHIPFKSFSKGFNGKNCIHIGIYNNNKYHFECWSLLILILILFYWGICHLVILIDIKTQYL